VRLKLELVTSTGSAAAASFSGTPFAIDRSEGAAMNRWSPYLLSILRIIAAFVYLVHGTQKLFGFPAPFPVPHLPPLFLAGGIIETFGGLLLLLGLFTRPVALIVSGEMAVAYFKFHAPQGFWPLLNDGEGAVLYCFIFLYLASSGGGPWSVDRLLQGRASVVVGQRAQEFL
jgi:putative oxidoreductase